MSYLELLTISQVLTPASTPTVTHRRGLPVHAVHEPDVALLWGEAADSKGSRGINTVQYTWGVKYCTLHSRCQVLHTYSM